MEIEILRKEIENIDQEIALLIEKRLKICQEIGEEKKKKNLPIFNQERENYLLQKNSSYVKKEYQEAYKNILKTIFEESKKLQK